MGKNGRAVVGVNGRESGHPVLNGSTVSLTPPPATEKSARQLLDEFEQTGCQQPFEEIVRRYGGMVFSVCFQVTKSAHDAEDATQAVFLSLAVQLRTGKQIMYLGPWLQQVARRMSMDIRRSRKRRQVREEIHGQTQAPRLTVPDSASPLHDGERALAVREEVDKLPAKYRMPLILHYFGGLSREEMARELKCRANTLGVRLHRGRQILAERLQKRGVLLGGMAAAPIAMDGLLSDVARNSVTSSLSTSLMRVTSDAASAIMLNGHTGLIADAVVSARVMKLARDVTTMMLLARVKFAAASIIVGMGLLTAGAGAIAQVLPARLQGPLHLPFGDLRDVVRRLISPITQILPQLVDAGTGHPVPSSEDLSDVQVRGLAFNDIALDPADEVNEWLGIKRTHEQSVPGIGVPVTRAAPRFDASFFARPDAPLVRADPVPARPNVMRTHDPLGRDHDEGYRVASSWQAPEPASSNALGASSARPDTPAAPAPTRPAAPAAQDVVTETVILASNLPVATAVHYDAEGSSLIGSSIGPITNLFQNSVTNSIALSFSADRASYSPASSLFVNPLVSRGATAVGTTMVLNGGMYDYTPARWNAGSPSVVRGFGTLRTGSAFVNNGVVVASGGTLRIDAPTIGNSIDNLVGERNGWYATQGGRLELPTTHVRSVDGRELVATWGEDASDPTLDLVNSVRVALRNVSQQGQLDIALLSDDRFDIPNTPRGTEAISIHEFDNKGIVFQDGTITFRYDDNGAALAGVSEAGLKIYTWQTSGWTRERSSIVDLSDKTIQLFTGSTLADYYAIGGNPARYGLSSTTGTVYYTPVVVVNASPDQGMTFTSSFNLTSAAPSVPEPASLAVVALGAGWLLRRPRRTPRSSV